MTGGGHGVVSVRCFGIPVSAGIDLLVGAAVIAILVNDLAGRMVPQASSVPIAITVSVLYVGSVLVHELGHALQARAVGAQQIRVILHALGGVTVHAGEERNAGNDYRVAVAGPLGTALVIVACELLGLAAGWSWADGSDRVLGFDPASGPDLVLHLLLATNVFLLATNLLPELPLDGGLIVRAVVWRLTGQRAAVERLLGAGGVALALGLAWYGLSKGGGHQILWLVLAASIGSDAAAYLRGGRTREAVDTLRLRDVLRPEAVVGSADQGLHEAWHTIFLPRPGLRLLAVTDTSGTFLGAVHRDAIQTAAAAEMRASLRRLVSDPRGDDMVAVARPDAPLTTIATSREHSLGNGLIVAVDEDGRYVGLSTPDMMRQAVNARAEATARPS